MMGCWRGERRLREVGTPCGKERLCAKLLPSGFAIAASLLFESKAKSNVRSAFELTHDSLLKSALHVMIF